MNTAQLRASKAAARELLQLSSALHAAESVMAQVKEETWYCLDMKGTGSGSHASSHAAPWRQ
eukprot:10776330-Karenia_brevis.AAC.1